MGTKWSHRFSPQLTSQSSQDLAGGSHVSPRTPGCTSASTLGQLPNVGVCFTSQWYNKNSSPSLSLEMARLKFTVTFLPNGKSAHLQTIDHRPVHWQGAKLISTQGMSWLRWGRNAAFQLLGQLGVAHVLLLIEPHESLMDRGISLERKVLAIGIALMSTSEKMGSRIFLGLSTMPKHDKITAIRLVSPAKI